MNTPQTTLLSLAFFVLLAACGDAAPPEVAQVEGENNSPANNPANNPENNPANNPENNDPPPEVVSPLAQVQVSVQPPRAVFAPGLRLLPGAAVLDAAGAPVTDAAVSWSVSPEGAAIPAEEGRWELITEGLTTFQGCARREGAAAVCGSLTVAVDAAAPRVVLLSPEPGAELLAAEHPLLVVQGRVIDSHGDLRAFVNGRPVELEDDGSFEVGLEPVFGVNHVVVTATDGFQRGESRAVADVLWAPDYLPATTEPVASFTFPDGVAVRLGQRFFDDGQPLSGTSGRVRTEDLADLLELVLRNLDLLGQLPDPVVDQPSLRLRITELRPGAPRVALELTDEGAELFIQLPQLAAHTEGSLTVEGSQVSLSGDLYAGLSGFARLRIAKAGLGQPWEVRVEEVALVIDDAIGVFQDSRAAAVFDLASSALRTTLEDTLTGVVADQFIQALPALLLDTLSSIEGALDGQTLPIDSGLGQPVTVSLAAEMGAVVPDYRTQLTAALTTTVQTDQPGQATGSRGAPLRAALDAPPPFLRESRLQLGVRLGLLNGLLHALWSSGLLEIDLSGVLPAQLQSLVRSGELSAALPPVLAPAAPGDPFDLRVTLGQLQLTVELNDRVDTYGVFLSTGVALDYFSGVLQITIADDPVIESWSIGSSAPATFFEGTEIADLIRDQVWPQLAEALVQTLTLQLPAIDASSLSEVAPALQDIRLDLALERDLRVRGDFIMLDANLEGAVTLPE